MSGPPKDELNRAVRPTATNRCHGNRDYTFHPELLRAVIHRCSLEHLVEFLLAREALDSGLTAGLIGRISGEEETRCLLGSLDIEPVRLDYSEAPNCNVGASAIHGEGLFAARNFEVGDVVADYSTSFAQWLRVPYRLVPQLGALSTLCWFVGESEEWARIASKTSTFMRANHASRPNTQWCPASKKLTALVPIPVGTEITYDYRLEIAPSSFKANPPAWSNS